MLRDVRAWAHKAVGLVLLTLALVTLLEMMVWLSQNLLRDATYEIEQNLSDQDLSQLREAIEWIEGTVPTADLIPIDQEINAQSALTLTLTLDATPRQMGVRYDLWLPAEHPLIRYIQSTMDSRLLAQQLLGTIKFNSESLALGPPFLEVGPQSRIAHVWLTAAPFSIDADSVFIEHIPPERQNRITTRNAQIIVNTDDVLMQSSVQPISQSPDRTIVAVPQDESRTYIGMIRAVVVAEQQISARSLANNLEWFGSIEIPFIGPLLDATITSLPLLLFLAIYQQYSQQTDRTLAQSARRFPYNRARRLRAVSFPAERLRPEKLAKLYTNIAILLIVFSFVFESLVAGRFGTFGWDTPARWIGYVLNRVQIVDFFYNNNNGTSINLILTVAAMLFWPALVRQWESSLYQVPPTFLRRFVRWTLIVVGVVLCVGIFGLTALLALSAKKFFFSSAPVQPFLACLVILPLLSIWLTNAVMGHFSLVRGLICATLLLILTFLHNLAELSQFDILREAPLVAQVSWTLVAAVNIIAATAILLACFRLTYPLVMGRSYAQDRQHWPRWARAGLLMLIILISLPTAWSFADVSNSRIGSFYLIGYDLRSPIILTLLWVLLRFFRRMAPSNTPLRLPQGVRALGILFSIAFFFSLARWFYLPVGILVGYVLIDRWLLNSPRANISNETITEITTSRNAIIQSMIQFHDAEKALKARRRSLLDKVGKGEKTYAEYNADIEQLENEVVQQRQGLVRYSPLVLAFGPTKSAWKNGQIGASYGLAFSLPWNVLYLRGLLQDDYFGAYSAALYLLSAILIVLLKWSLYGFFLGYFYAHIRGRNGLEKGFWLFVTLVLPTLATTAVISPLSQIAWQGTAVWAGQLFVHTMLLGLIAGDLETLRRVGFHWPQLFEVYDISALVGWGTSIIAATGASLAALLSSSAANWVATLLKLFIPAAPG